MVFILWSNNISLYANAPVQNSNSPNNIEVVVGLLAENGALNASTLHDLAAYSNDQHLKSIDTQIEKTAKCLSRISKKTGEAKSEKMIQDALVQDAIIACSNQMGYVISQEDQKFLNEVSHLVTNSNSNSNSPLDYTADEKIKLAKLNEKLYKKMRNRLINDYLSTIATLDRPLQDIDKELRHLTPYLPHRLKDHEKKDISINLPKYSEEKIKENRTRFFKTINGQLENLDKIHNMNFAIKGKKPEIANKILTLLAVQPQNETKKSAASTAQALYPSLVRLDMPSMVSTRDRLINPSVESKLILESQLAEKERRYKKLSIHEKMATNSIQIQTGSFAVEMLNDLDAISQQVTQKLQGTKLEEGLKLIADYKAIQDQAENYDRQIITLQNSVKSHPLVLATIRGYKNNNEVEKNTKLTPDILATFGLRGGFSSQMQGRLLNKYLEANRELIKEYEDWHNDSAPDGFIKNALYLDPLLSATIIAEDPSLAPLLCKVALNLDSDQLFEEKKDRIIGIASLVAIIGLGALSGGLGYVGAGALGSTVFAGGSFVVGGYGLIQETHDTFKTLHEAHNLENQFIALQVGDAEEIKTTYNLFKKKLAFAVLSGGLTAASAASFLKSANALTSASSLSSQSLKGQMEIVKGATENGKTLLVDNARAVSSRLQNPTELWKEIKIISNTKSPKEVAKLISGKMKYLAQKMQGSNHMKQLEEQAIALENKAMALKSQKEIAEKSIKENSAFLRASEALIKEEGLKLKDLKKGINSFQAQLKKVKIKLQSKMDTIAKMKSATSREALEAEKRLIDDLLHQKENTFMKLAYEQNPHLTHDEAYTLVARQMGATDEIKILRTNQKDLHEAIADFGNKDAFDHKLASMISEEADLIAQQRAHELLLSQAELGISNVQQAIIKIRNEINITEQSVKGFENQLSKLLEESAGVEKRIQASIMEAKMAAAGIAEDTGKDFIQQEASTVARRQATQDASVPKTKIMN